MKIRKARDSDVYKIYNISKDVKEFEVAKDSGNWPKNTLMNWIHSRSDVTLIAEEENKMVGFILCSCHAPTKKATIENLWVDKNQRKNGIASALIKEAEVRLKKVGVQYICALNKQDNKKMIQCMIKNKYTKGFPFLWMHKEL